jgi:spore maturation protein B
MASYEALLTTYGADSFIGLCASIIMASSDTIFYVICVYFSTSKIKKTRYLVPVAIFVFLFCVIFSSLLTRIFF